MGLLSLRTRYQLSSAAFDCTRLGTPDGRHDIQGRGPDFIYILSLLQLFRVQLPLVSRLVYD